WPGNQDDAVGLRHQLPQSRNVPFMKAEPLEIKVDPRAVEDAHDHALAEHGRNGRYPEIDVDPANRDLDTAVLGQTALGDVEPRHDLDARGDGGTQIRRQGLCRAQRAVDAVAHQDRVNIGLDVNVRCTLFHRAEDDLVDQPDGWRFARHVAQALDV